MALRFYASGAFYHVIGDTIMINKSTVCRVILAVTIALRSLTDRFISFPTNKASLRRIKQAFAAIAGFPNVIGCIDGSLFKIKQPKLNTEEYICRKGYAAINVQVKNKYKYK